MTVAEANIPSADSPAVARIKARLRPGARTTSAERTRLREELAQLQKRD